jgi:hypothetical protein
VLGVVKSPPFQMNTKIDQGGGLVQGTASRDTGGQ